MLIEPLISWASGELPTPGLPISYSEVGHCRLAVVYRVLGYEARPRQGHQQMVLDDGNLHEDDLVNRLRLAGITVYGRGLEVRHPVYPATGHIDGKINLRGFRIHLEIKSMSRFAFPRLQKQGLPGLRRYWLQTNGYLARLPDMDGTVVLAKCKDTCELYETPLLKLDLEAVEVFESRLADLTFCIREVRLPDPDPEGWECQECLWSHMCPYTAQERRVLAGVDKQIVLVDVSDEPELSKAAAAWREAQGPLKSYGKTEDGARAVFKQWLAQHPTTDGLIVAGVKVLYSSQQRLDTGLVRELAPEAVAQATKPVPVLKISEVEKVR